MRDMTVGSAHGHLWRYGAALCCLVTALGILFASAILAPRVGMVGITFACVVGWSFMPLFEIPYYFLACKKRGIPR